MRYLKAIGGAALLLFAVAGIIASVNDAKVDLETLGISVFLGIMGIVTIIKGNTKFWEI